MGCVDYGHYENVTESNEIICKQNHRQGTRCTNEDGGNWLRNSVKSSFAKIQACTANHLSSIQLEPYTSMAYLYFTITIHNKSINQNTKVTVVHAIPIRILFRGKEIAHPHWTNINHIHTERRCFDRLNGIFILGQNATIDSIRYEFRHETFAYLC